MTHPVGSPHFSGAKMPAFDDLVNAHTRAASVLEQCADDLWTELVRMRVDSAPAQRIRAIAERVRGQVTELRRRQSLVHAMQRQGGGARLCTVQGTYWTLPDTLSGKVPMPVPGSPPVEPVKLSFELREATVLPRPGRLRPDGTPFSPEEDAVLSWLEAHRVTIIEEARKWNVSPQSIAAAISWEAMLNVREPPDDLAAGWGFSNKLPNASFGPGKVHANFPLVNQIEKRGYLPRRSVRERELLLKSDEGSIRYIAAIMGAFSKAAEDGWKGPRPYSIRYNVPMLTQLYQGYDLEKWEKNLREREKAGNWDPPGFGDEMAVWASRNQEFLDAVLPRHPWRTDPVPAPPVPRPGAPDTPLPTTMPSPTPRS
ncbi:hypothetical protein FM076_27270 [Streptomyces albus subsp. chlorinus]|uniref:hypothetical protein n=1 Tax=Streptomyces albus TaxID=1888 RepID=UPI001570C9DB|nr:hypothetical protein [Streptomyces albus]NSC24657.1 hypothetical protein [Streptomyces albus subsp. chlorinus]